MNSKNIPNKILHWYDNNKRILPWRKQVSRQKREYFTFVSEYMLQQTQVKTVIPYFNKFVKLFPNFQSLSKVSEENLLKQWEGLGYYSRARNLRKSAIKISKELNGRLPKTYDELLKLPGVGDYTAKAIMSIAFNIKIIPLDGNVERILKRTLYLKKQNEISKDFLKTKINFFGLSDRASDYSQAIMEIGALICKPKNPSCKECPLNKNCISLKKNDFELTKINKEIKTKYFEATIYKKQNNYLLVKNDKFKFLKNMPIFPMTEVKESKYNYSNNKKINIKLSNMEMKILLNNSKKPPKIKNKILIKKDKLSSEIIPSFTKKIFYTISKSE
jgi:A/G-specific adenine glycosylase